MNKIKVALNQMSIYGWILLASLGFTISACSGGGNSTPPASGFSSSSSISSSSSSVSSSSSSSASSVSSSSSDSSSSSSSVSSASSSSSASSVSSSVSSSSSTSSSSSSSSSASSSSSSSSSATLYGLGGNITGLTASDLMLTNNGTQLSVVSGATHFNFGAAFVSGAVYAVSVSIQPAGLICSVSNGTGTITTNVNNVQVSCITLPQWTWKSGSNVVNTNGVYGTQGIAAAGNVPGARIQPVSWTDKSTGKLWLFGGFGLDHQGGEGRLNDLWQYDPLIDQWTWVSGANSVRVTGVYGTQGVSVSTNVPGARSGAMSWIDAAGNLWLFGGNGNDANGTVGYLNDLWKYNPTSQQWVWISGSNVANANGVYGTQGIPAASNVPGARDGSVSWIDSAGNFWVFGGSNGNGNNLNDLWKYSPTTQLWTWVSGTKFVNASGTYGIQGTADASNLPSARGWSVSWIDSSNNLWLFGGLGIDSVAASGDLNDLWEYTPSSNQWVWVSGSKFINVNGIYGAQNVAALGNTPGARDESVSWVDSENNLLLFGGEGYDANGTFRFLNDLWKYSPTTQQWTWVSGSKLSDVSGVYGALGIPALSNVPGGRYTFVSWFDNSTLWLFGGYGLDSTGALGYLNDMWKRN